MELGSHRQEASHDPDQEISLGLHRALRRRQHLDPGEDEERAEDPDDPVKLHQQRPEADEQRAEDQRAEDTVEQHAVLVARGYAEVTEHHDEHEDVVDGQRVLDDVAGEKFQRGLPGRRSRVEAWSRGEPHILWELPEGILVERDVERQAQAHPDRAPARRLPEPHLARLAMEHPEVESEEHQDAAGEREVEPPVLAQREQRRCRRHAPPSPATGGRQRMLVSHARETICFRQARAVARGDTTSTAQVAWRTTRSCTAPNSSLDRGRGPWVPSATRSACHSSA